MANGPKSRRRRGYIVIALSVSGIFLLGMVGLAVDLGRMYVARAESQSFADSAAMFAAKELNGTAVGVQNATNKVAWVMDPAGPSKLSNFNTTQFQNIVTEYATAWNAATWVDPAAAAVDPANYFFVRVTASAPVNMWFLPILTGGAAGTVRASAIAGRSASGSFTEGLAPFAPFQLPTRCTAPNTPPNCCTDAELVGCSYNASDPFHMVTGQWYTLRWVSGNLKDTDLPNFCPGEQCQCMKRLANDAGAHQRGYALYQGASDIREAIVGDPPPHDPITTGSVLPLQNGQVATEMNALDDRVMQDTDTTATRYRNTDADTVWWDYPDMPPSALPYQGADNGRRIVVVPIASYDGAYNGGTYTAVGFAGFFLGPRNTYRSGHMSTVGACAQYLREFTVGAGGSGGVGPGTGPVVYTLRLYR